MTGGPGGIGRKMEGRKLKRGKPRNTRKTRTPKRGRAPGFGVGITIALRT